jgi:hypothetical protein
MSDLNTDAGLAQYYVSQTTKYFQTPESLRLLDRSTLESSPAEVVSLSSREENR